jgi:HEAT repeat protein
LLSAHATVYDKLNMGKALFFPEGFVMRIVKLTARTARRLASEFGAAFGRRRFLHAIATSCIGLPLTAGVSTAQQVTPPKDQLQQKDIEKRRSAELVNGLAMDAWIDALRKDKDPSVRLRAVATLKAYGSAAKVAIPDLLKCLTEPDASMRVNACITLGFLGFDDRDIPNAVEKISRLLEDHQGIVQYQAALTLAKLGTAANPAVPKLAALTNSKISWEIRAAAAAALGSVGYSMDKGADGQPKGLDGRAMGALINTLRDPCMEVRFEALRSLLFLGRPATTADKGREDAALRLLYTDKHEKVAIWSRVVFMRINSVSEDHLSAIAKFLKPPRGDASKADTLKAVEGRVEALKAFATIGYDAKSKVDDIMNCLDDKDSYVQIWAIAAISQMKDAGAKAIPMLEKLETTPTSDSTVKEAAKSAIERLGGGKKKP